MNSNMRKVICVGMSLQGQHTQLKE